MAKKQRREYDRAKHDKAKLEAEYRQMAVDKEREAEALEWAEGLIGDVADDDDESQLHRKKR